MDRHERAERIEPQQDEPSGVVATSHARELDPVLGTLRRHPLLADLPEADLAAIARSARVLDYPRHTYVFHRGDAGDGLYIVISGVIEIIIQRGPEQNVNLSTCEAGDFFGEVALIDGLPRSATARALSDCQLLAITREALDDTLLLKLSARINNTLAQRLRKTDHMLADMAERVARAAYANVNSAVSVELDSIKTLHRHTEQVATATLQQAERRAQEVLGRADAIAGDLQGRLEKIGKVLKRYVAPVAVVLSTLAIWYGVSTIEDVHKKAQELMDTYNEAQKNSAELERLVASSTKIVERLEAKNRRAQALEETVGELRAVRDAVGLNQPIDTREQLQRAALNYEQAKQEIRERYLSGTHYEDYEAAVIFEAVNTYVTLVTGGGDDGQLYLDQGERSDLLMALSYVLGNLVDVPDPTVPGHAARLFDRKVRDMLSYVIMGADARLRERITQQLTAAFDNTSSRRAQESLALSLADIGQAGQSTKKMLQQLQKSRDPQRAAPAALALAKLGDVPSYMSLLQMLEQSASEVAYPTALLIAELGSSGLRELCTAANASDDLSHLRARIEQVLSTHTPKNCLEERYARHVLHCFDGTSCPAHVSDDESCPNYSAAQH